MHHFCYSFAQGELFCDHAVSIMLCIPPGITVSRPRVVKWYNKEIIKKRDGEDNGVIQQTKWYSPRQTESCWLLFVSLKKVQPSSLIKYCAFLSNRLFFLYSKSGQRWAKQFQSNRMSPLAFMKHTVNRVHKAMLRL